VPTDYCVVTQRCRTISPDRHVGVGGDVEGYSTGRAGERAEENIPEHSDLPFPKALLEEMAYLV
jgi:hypothetical protein